MIHPPDMEALTRKILEIVETVVDNGEPLKPDIPLMSGLGLDSLDLIEVSFALEEFFEFQFGERNAVEVLDRALGGDRLIRTGKLTPEGLKMALRRMPELASLELPEELSPLELQQYYTIESFARLIREFYLAAPDRCPETGEAAVLDQFRIVYETSREPVPVPGGDELIDRWVARMAAEIENSKSDSIA